MVSLEVCQIAFEHSCCRNYVLRALNGTKVYRALLHSMRQLAARCGNLEHRVFKGKNLGSISDVLHPINELGLCHFISIIILIFSPHPLVHPRREIFLKFISIPYLLMRLPNSVRRMHRQFLILILLCQMLIDHLL